MARAARRALHLYPTEKRALFVQDYQNSWSPYTYAHLRCTLSSSLRPIFSPDSPKDQGDSTAQDLVP